MAILFFLLWGWSSNNYHTHNLVDKQGVVNTKNLSAYLTKLPTSTLNETERSGLLQMYAKSQLAYQMYLQSYQLCNKEKVRRLVSAREQSHLAAIELLLNRYGLQDSIKRVSSSFSSNQIGAFQKPREKSDVVQWSCKMEESDINDLNLLLSNTDNEDVKFVFELLNKTSRNNLRFFHKKLHKLGGSYSANYLSQAAYDEIVSSSKERKKRY